MVTKAQFQKIMGSKKYASGPSLPQEVPKGQALAHNHIRHSVRTKNGARGFRWWTWPKDQVPANFASCKCGWAGLPHYSPKPE
jgi:hypothetical protein